MQKISINSIENIKLENTCALAYSQESFDGRVSKFFNS